MIRRVLLVSPYALSVPGGAQTQVAAMARELRRRDLDVTVASPGEPLERLAAAGVVHVATGRVALLPANGSRAPVTLSLAASRTTARLAAALEGGVVHVHEPFAPVMGYATLLQHRRPTVATFHRGGGGPAYAIGRPLIARLRRGIDVAVAVSDHAAATVRAGAGIDADVLGNALELERFTAAADLPTLGPTVLFVGRHEPRKGLGVLLDAVAQLDGELTVWVVGSGPQTEALMAATRGDDRIVWLGRLDDDQVASRMAAATVLCVPSLGGESFGLVPAEGLAAGAIVVASDIPGYREALDGAATLVAPGDPTALAAALRDALARHDEPGRRDAARAFAARWSMATLVEHYLERYALATSRFDARAAGRGRSSARR